MKHKSIHAFSLFFIIVMTNSGDICKNIDDGVIDTALTLTIDDQGLIALRSWDQIYKHYIFKNKYYWEIKHNETNIHVEAKSNLIKNVWSHFGNNSDEYNLTTAFSLDLIEEYNRNYYITKDNPQCILKLKEKKIFFCRYFIIKNEISGQFHIDIDTKDKFVVVFNPNLKEGEKPSGNYLNVIFITQTKEIPTKREYFIYNMSNFAKPIKIRDDQSFIPSFILNIESNAIIKGFLTLEDYKNKIKSVIVFAEKNGNGVYCIVDFYDKKSKCDQSNWTFTRKLFNCENVIKIKTTSPTTIKTTTLQLTEKLTKKEQTSTSLMTQTTKSIIFSSIFTSLTEVTHLTSTTQLTSTIHLTPSISPTISSTTSTVPIILTISSASTIPNTSTVPNIITDLNDLPHDEDENNNNDDNNDDNDATAKKTEEDIQSKRDETTNTEIIIGVIFIIVMCVCLVLLIKTYYSHLKKQKINEI